MARSIEPLKPRVLINASDILCPIPRAHSPGPVAGVLKFIATDPNPSGEEALQKPVHCFRSICLIFGITIPAPNVLVFTRHWHD